MEPATRKEEIEAERSLSRARELRKAGRVGKAVDVLRTLIHRHPEYVGALYELGMLHIEKKEFAAALPFMVRAAMHNPKDYRMQANLAALYFELDAYDMAEHTNRFAIKLNPKSREIRFVLANALVKQRKYEAAAAEYQSALELDDQYLDAAIRLGECYEHLGMTTNAINAYFTALNMRSGDKTRALYALSDLPQQLVGIDVLAELEKLPPPPADAIKNGDVVRNLLTARALDKAGEHDRAWKFICQVKNALRPEHENDYDTASKFERNVLNAVGDFPIKIAEDEAADTTTALFVLGPSRSGKSTLERMLAQCEGFALGYENELVRQSVKAANQVAGRLSSDVLMRLPMELYPTFSRFYRDSLAHAADENKVYTTTTPGLVASVPQIMAAIPLARFVFVKRDRRDTMLRIFFRRYKSGNHYAYDLGWIDEYLNWYYSLIDIYCAKYPQHTMVVNYEDLVTDTTSQVRRVLDFVGHQFPADAHFSVGDDRGCSKPYLEMMEKALTPDNAAD